MATLYSQLNWFLLVCLMVRYRNHHMEAQWWRKGFFFLALFATWMCWLRMLQAETASSHEFYMCNNTLGVQHHGQGCRVWAIKNNYLNYIAFIHSSVAATTTCSSFSFNTHNWRGRSTRVLCKSYYLLPLIHFMFFVQSLLLFAKWALALCNLHWFLLD